jgi:hypothetical protein
MYPGQTNVEDMEHEESLSRNLKLPNGNEKLENKTQTVEVGQIPKDITISLEAQINTKVNDQKADNKSENKVKTEEIDPAVLREIDAEVEKAIETRKNCIRAECEKSKKRIDLGSSRIDDLDALNISLYLNEQKSPIELFHVGANLLTDEGLINLLSGLQWHTNLKELYIGNNKR